MRLKVKRRDVDQTKGRGGVERNNSYFARRPLQKLPQTRRRHGNRLATTEANMSDAFRCLERLRQKDKIKCDATR